MIADSALPAKVPTWKGDIPAAPPATVHGLDLVFRPDPAVWDGRFANNGWLQELPKPLTKLTWDNAALISPAAAERLGVQSGDVVELTFAGRRLNAPVWILPGQADGTVTLHLGYGRTQAGRVGTGIGVNAYLLRTAAAPWCGSGLTLKKTGERFRLASTQGHQTMEGRNLVRMATAEEFRKHPDFARDPGDHEAGHQPSFYPAHKYEGYAWGMAIDLNACTGCNACVVACQSENNSPVVGKDQVPGRPRDALDPRRSLLRGRPGGPRDGPSAGPVHAVRERALRAGLSGRGHRAQQRRAERHGLQPLRRHPLLLQQLSVQGPALQLPPVRRRPDPQPEARAEPERDGAQPGRHGEVHLLRPADQRSPHPGQDGDRDIQDGEVITACQAVCPSQAIVFGNINDPKSRVSQLKAHPLNYGLLAELNTRPRTTYLARLRNPNPALEQG